LAEAAGAANQVNRGIWLDVEALADPHQHFRVVMASHGMKQLSGDANAGHPIQAFAFKGHENIP
jgi:hypothetical protein